MIQAFGISDRSGGGPDTAKANEANGRTIQYITLKVRLYPSETQVELFENTFGRCRYIWNRMLAARLEESGAAEEARLLRGQLHQLVPSPWEEELTAKLISSGSQPVEI